MSLSLIRIATRASPLALWQAQHVAQRLRIQHPQIQVELVSMTTQGDQLLNSPLSKIGGKGLFVKELETALLENRADIAVHSMKDVPMSVHLPEGLAVPVILEREDPRDAFVSAHYTSLMQLPEQAIVGTCSLRRRVQLIAHRPDLQLRDLRGNVNTRLKKLDDGEFDAIILAAAGLKRLGLGERITATLSQDFSLPACGQGAIGIECRHDDLAIRSLIAPLNHEDTAICVNAERTYNARLNGGCQAPIAGFAELTEQGLWLRGLVGEPDSSTPLITGEVLGDPQHAHALATRLADDLLQRGAAQILHAIYGHQPAV